MSTLSISADNGKFLPLQNFTFNNPPGLVPTRQDNSHIYQALVDTTGQYILFPDLGADLVHVYCVDPNTGSLVGHTPLKQSPGTVHAMQFSSPTTLTRSFVLSTK
jgi:6-phosphogluconolactonase (cycloisomerase 2 family)